LQKVSVKDNCLFIKISRILFTISGPYGSFLRFKYCKYKKAILLCSKLSHDALTDLTAEKFSNVVILTDFDEQGTILNKKLAKLFETRGVKLDRFYRSRFRKLQFLDGNQIEKCEKSAFWAR